MGKLSLRASLVWNGEVMDDVVLDKPEPITIGRTGKTTFVTPALEHLAAELAIIRPGTLGYVLVLVPGMRGTVSIGGQQRSVEELLGNEQAAATPLAEGDWGVVELSESCSLFFQFVPREQQAVIATKQQLMIASAGFGVFSLAGTAIWAAKGLDVGEAIARGLGVTALMFALAWLGRTVARQNGESQASLGFSIALHTAILLLTFQVYAQQTAAAAMTPQRDLMASYTVTRPAEAAPVLVAIPKSLPTLGELAPTPAAPKTEAQPVVAPNPVPDPSGGGRTKGTGGRPGADPVSQFGMLGNPALKSLVQHQIGGGVGALTGANGNGTGDDGTDGVPGKGGLKTKPGDTKGGPRIVKTTTDGPKIELRKGGVCIGQCGGGVPISIEPPPTTTDDGEPPLTMKEVDDAIRLRQGLFRACYQRKLNQIPDLAGSVVMRWSIRKGRVSNQKIVGGTLKDGDVTQCMLTGLGSLQFPAHGAALVTYPFVFSAGS